MAELADPDTVPGPVEHLAPVWRLGELCVRQIAELMAWTDRFTDPITMPNGDRIETLRDAGAYIARLPNRIYKTDPWRTATHLLIEAAEGAVSIELARFAILQAFAGEQENAAVAG